MAEEDRAGWWDVPAAETWTCPACRASSPVSDWRTCDVDCESCGDHDGRVCPACGLAWDHVWGAERIARAMKEGIHAPA